jgi:DNA-binding CsgD family transcriptional regulator
MQLAPISANDLKAVLDRVDPFVAAIDADGQILDRRVSDNRRFPADMMEARSLRSFLSAPVAADWLRLVRGAIAENRPHAAILILDGIAHEAVAAPHAVTRDGRSVRVSLLSLFPNVLEFGQAEGSGIVRVVVRAHEWGPLEDLTRCQLDTLRHVSMGLTNIDIAGRIFRTKRAVEWHIRFLHDTLGIHNRERLAMLGREAGLHCFRDEEWTQVLKTRPARRPAAAREPDPNPAHAA